MKQILFAEDFRKLEKETFTAIRREDKKLVLHEIVEIISPKKEFKAECISCSFVKLEDVPALVLVRDLDCDFNNWFENYSHEHLLKQLRKFIPAIEWEDYIYLYLFRRRMNDDTIR